MLKFLSLILFVFVHVYAKDFDLSLIPEGNLRITPNNDDTTTFTITSNVTDKWIGFGISASGSMMSCDMFIFDPSELTITRKISEGFFKPENSPHQNLFVTEETTVNDTHSKFSFTVPNKNQFNGRFDIIARSMWLNYAMGDLPFTYHGAHNRGSLLIDPLEPERSSVEGEETETIEYLVEGGIVDHTKVDPYTCTWIQVHEPERKRHVVEWEVILTSELVHHIVIFGCTPQYIFVESEPTQRNDCTMPPAQCGFFVTGWAPGMGTRIYPSQVGVPLGGDSWRTLVIQMHYNNPDGIQGVYDASGMRAKYTYSLREFSTFDMLWGINPPRMIVPPGQKTYVIDILFPSACTDWPTSKYLLGSIPHMHYLGVKAELRLIRDGQEIEKLYFGGYEFNFQAAYFYSDPVEIKPGDLFEFTCIFDSTTRTETTFGGDYSDEEMCLTFLTFYHDDNKFENCMIEYDGEAPNKIYEHRFTDSQAKQMRDYQAQAFYINNQMHVIVDPEYRNKFEGKKDFANFALDFVDNSWKTYQCQESRSLDTENTPCQRTKEGNASKLSLTILFSLCIFKLFF